MYIWLQVLPRQYGGVAEPMLVEEAVAQIRAAAAGAEREKASRKADQAPAAAEDVGRIRGAGRSDTLLEVAVPM